jgi:hypothetical protein
MALSASASSTRRARRDSTRGSTARTASPPPAADHHRQRVQRQGVGRALHHRRQRRQGGRAGHRIQCCQEYPPGPVVQRRTGGQQRRAGHAGRAANDRDVAVAALVAGMQTRARCRLPADPGHRRPGARRCQAAVVGGHLQRRRTRHWPAASRPIAVNRPGLSVSRLSVWRARTCGPGQCPVSASSPVGRSMARTGAPQRFMASIHSRHPAPAGALARADAQQGVHMHKSDAGRRVVG